MYLKTPGKGKTRRVPFSRNRCQILCRGGGELEGMICTIYYRGVFPGGGGIDRPVFFNFSGKDIDKVFNRRIVIINQPGCDKSSRSIIWHNIQNVKVLWKIGHHKIRHRRNPKICACHKDLRVV